MARPTRLTVLGHYARFIPSFLLGLEPPFVLGLVITDRCNMSCRHCRVANTGRRDMTLAEIEASLSDHCKRGFRELYIEGGEPFLWRDGDKCLDDVVRLARDIGYFHVHVYTNGTVPLVSDADRLWVSVDGLEEHFAAVRGPSFGLVMRSLRDTSHTNVGIIYTVNSANKDGIGPFLEHIARERLPVRGVFFFFHTPSYGKDELFLDFEQRRPVIHDILRHKRRGLPVLNSVPGLKTFESGAWKRPHRMFAIADVDRNYVCCRYNSPEVCEHCGYACAAEFDQARKLSPGAIGYFLGMR